VPFIHLNCAAPCNLNIITVQQNEANLIKPGHSKPHLIRQASSYRCGTTGSKGRYCINPGRNRRLNRPSFCYLLERDTPVHLYAASFKEVNAVAVPWNGASLWVWH